MSDIGCKKFLHWNMPPSFYDEKSGTIFCSGLAVLFPALFWKTGFLVAQAFSF